MGVGNSYYKGIDLPDFGNVIGAGLGVLDFSSDYMLFLNLQNAEDPMAYYTLLFCVLPFMAWYHTFHVLCQAQYVFLFSKIHTF